MNRREHQLDLSALSYAEKVGVLVYLLVEKKNEITFNLESDASSTVTINGTLDSNATNDKYSESILQFLMSKLKKTNQSIFKRNYSDQTYTHTEYDKIVVTDEIDWSMTVSYLVHNSMGDIRTRQGNIDSHEGEIVTHVGGVSFDIPVYCLGRRSHEADVKACQDAILAEYKRVTLL